MLRAILVCVDFADILCRTLPYNRHHFDEVCIVTTPSDHATHDVASKHDARIVETTAFYDDGASFNKWKALEYGLDVYGRHGWLCIMDADIFWPKEIPFYYKIVGDLYTPYRRVRRELHAPIPPEEEWDQFPIHRNVKEFAGYSQIFHADDPSLGEPPWHAINWKHAGGADSFFQRKWPRQRKVRPPFEVLHIGPHGENWCGRVSPFAGGEKPEESLQRYKTLRGYLRRRRQTRNYKHEKLFTRPKRT